MNICEPTYGGYSVEYPYLDEVVVHGLDLVVGWSSKLVIAHFGLILPTKESSFLLRKMLSISMFTPLGIQVNLQTRAILTHVQFYRQKIC